MMLVQATLGSAFMQINFLLLAGVVTGVVLFYRGFRLLQRKRLIQDVPSSSIRSAALGLVEVSGTVAGESTLLSPVCQEDCCFYELSAWRPSDFGEYYSWKKAAEESFSVPFFLEDETGRVAVDPKGADLEIPTDFSEEYGMPRTRSNVGLAAEYAMNSEVSPPETVAHFLARHGLSAGERVRVEERSIKLGDKLFVLGTLAENTRGQVETDERTEYLTASAAQVQRDVALSTVFPDAERKLFTAPREAVQTNTKTITEARVVLRKGANNPTFFISTFSHQQILEELRWKTPLYIFGGPALTLFCLWNLFSRFGVI